VDKLKLSWIDITVTLLDRIQCRVDHFESIAYVESEYQLLTVTQFSWYWSPYLFPKCIYPKPASYRTYAYIPCLLFYFFCIHDMWPFLSLPIDLIRFPLIILHPIFMWNRATHATMPDILKTINGYLVNRDSVTYRSVIFE
jgi:hypothetical protein